MELHVSEHKSVGQARPDHLKHTVRVFVDGDYHYGYFVEENALLALLDDQAQRDYLAAPADVKLDVSKDVAQKVIDMGVTPYAKAKLA